MSRPDPVHSMGGQPPPARFTICQRINHDRPTVAPDARLYASQYIHNLVDAQHPTDDGNDDGEENHRKNKNS
jgi:hypothetical protein